MEVSRSSGDPPGGGLRSLGDPWELAGGPQGVPGGSLGGPGGTWGVPGGCLGSPWGVPGEVCGGAWVGIEKHSFLKAHGEEREAFHSPCGPPPDHPRARPSGTRGLSQSLRSATLRFSLRFRFRFTSLSLRFAFRFASLSLRFTSLFESNRIEFRSPHADGSADNIYIYMYILYHIL